MLSMFNCYGVQNHSRIPAVDWKSLPNNGFDGRTLRELAVRISHLEALKYFVDNQLGDYCLIAEDDLSFQFVDYWDKPFWSYMEIYNSVKWNVIQLTVNMPTSILYRTIDNFRLDTPHRRKKDYWSACLYLITLDHAASVIEQEQFIGWREYAKKFTKEVIDTLRKQLAFAADSYFIYDKYHTYTIPLFTYNNDFESTVGGRLQNHIQSHDHMLKMLWAPKLHYKPARDT